MRAWREILAQAGNGPGNRALVALEGALDDSGRRLLVAVFQRQENQRLSDNIGLDFASQAFAIALVGDERRSKTR